MFAFPCFGGRGGGVCLFVKRMTSKWKMWQMVKILSNGNDCMCVCVYMHACVCVCACMCVFKILNTHLELQNLLIPRYLDNHTVVSSWFSTCTCMYRYWVHFCMICRSAWQQSDFNDFWKSQKLQTQIVPVCFLSVEKVGCVWKQSNCSLEQVIQHCTAHRYIKIVKPYHFVPAVGYRRPIRLPSGGSPGLSKGPSF